MGSNRLQKWWRSGISSGVRAAYNFWFFDVAVRTTVRTATTIFVSLLNVSRAAQMFHCNLGWFKYLLSGLVLAGCSGDNLEPVHPVTGTVMMKGKPVEGAIVAFTPTDGGTAASGATDSTGTYKLTTRSSGDGAVAGKYSVTIAKYDKRLEEKKAATTAPGELADPYDITNEYPTGYDEMQASEIAASLSKNLLPPRFANPAMSKLSAEVSEGTNAFDFKLD